LRRWVTGTSFLVTQPYLSHRCWLLHYPGSVRRASGFVLVGNPDTRASRQSTQKADEILEVTHSVGVLIGRGFAPACSTHVVPRPCRCKHGAPVQHFDPAAVVDGESPNMRLSGSSSKAPHPMNREGMKARRKWNSGDEWY
jgi:hypothetical protein